MDNMNVRTHPKPTGTGMTTLMEANKVKEGLGGEDFCFAPFVRLDPSVCVVISEPILCTDAYHDRRCSLDHQPNNNTSTKIQRVIWITIKRLNVAMLIVSSFNCS